jgi:branched-chain amino acid transport system substrate-binding protein
MMGGIDFTKGPVGNVCSMPMIGAQWVKPPAGSKYKYEYVITDNAGDPKVPVGTKPRQYA